jgi:hypothetical protein
MNLHFIDILVFVAMGIEFNWKAFWVGSFTSLVLLLNSPIFKKFTPKSYVSYFVIALTAWATLLHYFLEPEPEKGAIRCKQREFMKVKMCYLNFWDESRVSI